jgi:hypothetical protein
MSAENGRSRTTLFASVGIIACLGLQGLQTFFFAPLAGAEGSYFLAVVGLFVCVTSISTLSFLNMPRSASASAILYAAFFTGLWWHFVCKGKFIQSDFVWIELPSLIFATGICIRSAARSAGASSPSASTPH